MGLCPGTAGKLSSGTNAWKNVSAEPSTKNGVEAVRFCAFSPPGSPLDRHSVVVPLTMNNPGLQTAQKDSERRKWNDEYWNIGLLF
jgi:hypothetical protein